MSVRVRKPTTRVCERCGRTERWNDGGWQLRQKNDEKAIGNLHCIHEWDINGTFNPIEP